MIGRRVYLTVLFSDVSDSSAHAEQLEAEEYARLLERFREFARDIIPRHGGTIARLQGDGVLALFGHVEPSEDDGRRATEAALDLHAAVGTLRTGVGSQATALQMHSGVHGGLVLLLAGDIERGRFDVVGEVPNTAARLSSLAAPGEVAVSEETLGPRAAHFAATRSASLKIRGRSELLTVLRVSSRLDTHLRRIDAGHARGAHAFIGRSETIRDLMDATERAATGDPQAIVLMGEPGIGKTRLVAEFARRVHAPDVTVLQGYCESYLSAEPMQPFIQCMRQLTDSDQLDGAQNATLAALARARSGVAAAADAAAERAWMIDRLNARAQRGTLVLLLDDWQWADDASRAMLRSLWSLKGRVLVVLAVRPVQADEIGFSDARVLRLSPLDAAQCGAAIAERLPAADPFVIEAIAAQSGGTPLFIEELCHAFAEGANVRLAERGRGLSWLNSLVASRLWRLPPAQVDLLQTASVAGTVVSLDLLRRLVGEESFDRLKVVIENLDFLVAGEQPGTVRFRHGLTRDAIYNSVDLERRRALHDRVAAALQSSAEQSADEAPIEALAYHFDAAGRTVEAARYAEAAGHRALAAMALDRARAYYLMALRCLDALPQMPDATRRRWCEIAQRLGQTCVFDVLDVEQLLSLFQRAAAYAEQSNDANLLARAEYWLGYVHYGKGLPRQAIQHCDRALQLAEASQDTRLAAQVQATLGQSLASAGLYQRAFSLLRGAVVAKRMQSRPGSGAAVGSAYTLARIGYTLADLGRFDEASDAFEESLELLGDPMHAVGASIRELICAAHLWQGRWAEAGDAGRAGALIALNCRSRFNSAMGRALAACADWADQKNDSALQTLREATHWIEVRGGAVSTSLNYGWLVEAKLDAGRMADARRYMARLLMRARAQDRHGEAQGWRAMAIAVARGGDLARASFCLAAAERAAAFRASPREDAVNALAAAHVALLASDRPAARRRVDEAAAAFDAMKMHWHLQRALALAASVG